MGHGFSRRIAADRQDAVTSQRVGLHIGTSDCWHWWAANPQVNVADRARESESGEGADGLEGVKAQRARGLLYIFAV